MRRVSSIILGIFAIVFLTALPNAQRFAPLVVRGRECEVKARMLHEQRAKLASGIAAGAKYTDGDSIHARMHNNTLVVGQSPGGLG